MTTIEQITKIVSEAKQGFLLKSNYIQFGKKLIRIANHLPNEINFRIKNEGVEEILLIIVNDEYNSVTERELSLFVANEMQAYICEELLINEDENIEDYLFIVERFINN